MPDTREHRLAIIQRLLQVLVICWLVIGQFLQINTGLADTGDYLRSMLIFTSGPVGIEPVHPSARALQPELWEKRYFLNWLPYWKLDFPSGVRLWLDEFNSSSFWLWYPGVLVNWLVYSQNILYLPSISLLPRLLMILFMLLAFWWIDHSDLKPVTRLVLTITLSIPLALFFVNHNYSVYFNSFFTETALMVYLLAFLASLIYLRRRPSVWRYAFCLLMLFLLSAGKASAVYWPFLALWFVFPIQELFARPVRYLARYLVLAAGITGLAVVFINPWDWIVPANVYNSLFNGVLVYSEDVPARLEELGLSEALPCSGEMLWTPSGRECFNTPAIYDKLTPRAVLHVLYKEPRITLDLARYALDRMQITTLKLGTRERGDNGPDLAASGLNIWSRAKLKLFPQGYWLAACLLLYLLLFGVALRRSGFIQELAMVGMLTSIASILDMAIAVFGEGRTDIVKHLFFSNYLFDLATIAAINVLILLLMDLVTRKSFLRRQWSQKSEWLLAL